MRYYLCFSWKQKEFLKESGFRYEFKARHIGNGKVFYFYFWSYQLDLCLREYSEIKRIELELGKDL
ncbi:TPA: hypothetical protein PTV74_003112 [Clostridium botulinum]|nr:hypothetical protein [Clostridium botulinum]HDK7210003.1 hypothetical protein [Clostridium botulinum]HDK7265452.1 hypothetical protein [Clostridium botulinum]HDK7269300.1 hypothetical protein [Clostridium botulinum]HDK7298302.1 hypothetical protein [Clostridium botulinum]